MQLDEDLQSPIITDDISSDDIGSNDSITNFQDIPAAESIDVYKNIKGTSLIVSFFDKDIVNGQAFYSPKNIALDFGKSKELDVSLLGDIVQKCTDSKSSGELSMKVWRESAKESRERVYTDEKATLDGSIIRDAANYRNSDLLSICKEFSDNAYTEHNKRQNIASFRQAGTEELSDDIEAAAGRLETFLNHEVSEKIPGWDQKNEKMIYQLPVDGCIFKKTYFDPAIGCINSSLITYPNFFLDNENTDCLEELRAFTEQFKISESQIKLRENAGIYRERESASNDDYNADSSELVTLFEQHCYLDLDKDGIEEPYIVLYTEAGDVLSILPRFELNQQYSSVVYKDADNDMLQVSDVNVPQKGSELVAIKAINTLSKYDFIPDFRGGFLGVSYYTCLRRNLSVIDKSTNLLIDGNKLSNIGTHMLSSDLSADDLELGSVIETSLNSAQLQNSIMSFYGKAVDQNVIALRQSEQQNVLGFAGGDLTNISSNTPAFTAFSVMEKMYQSSSAINRRIIKGLTEELNIIFRLSSQYMLDATYSLVVGKDADFDSDYKITEWKVSPTANPDHSSRLVNASKANLWMSVLQQISTLPIPVQGLDAGVIVKEIIDLIGLPTEKVFPEIGAEEQLNELLSKFPELQEMISTQQQSEEQLAQAQLENQEEVDELRKQEISAKIEKLKAEKDEIESRIPKNIALSQKHAEESEKIESETIGQEIDNEQKVGPKVTLVVGKKGDEEMLS